jgi:TetR/AcrR family transcriptional regulator, regulator of biofilm formation and stress response
MAHVAAADRRQQFIEAAARVIQKHGVARATTRNIAEEAGAPLGALHYCFGTKEELFEAVSHTYSHAGLAPALAKVHAGMGIAAAAAVVLQSTAKFIAANMAADLAEFDFFIWALRSDRPEIPKRTYDIWMSLIQGALELARTESELDQDILSITRMLISLMDGYSLIDMMRNEQFLEESAETATRTVAAAIDAGVFRRS